MLDTQDTEFGVQLGGRAYRPVRREGSYIKALGTRIGCRVDERMAAQYHTIGVHKLSCWVEMQFRKTQHCYKSTVVQRRGAQKIQTTERSWVRYGKHSQTEISKRRAERSAVCVDGETEPGGDSPTALALRPKVKLQVPRRMRLPLRHSFYLVAVLGLACSMQPNSLAQGAERVSTTAWQAGHFAVDAAGLLGRSDIVLGQPNTKPAEAMPMGNGRLGIAVWAADGFTAQLNRADTLPHRDSPGQIVIPGLAALTSAKDFSGRLDLYNGSLVGHRAGITRTAYVQTATDTLVVDVTGADPEVQQTATLRLWEPRKPKATAADNTGTLAES